jgi:acyl-CoA reductase-like NAD-dependent aldehyde dehydrogenase
MFVTHDETCGPVAPFFKFEVKAIMAEANEMIFGLAPYFYSNDLYRLTRVH